MLTHRNAKPGAWRLLLLIFILCTANHAGARELYTAPEDLVAVELAMVGVSSLTGAPVVVLRYPPSGDVVPIVVGPVEARAILMALQEVPVPRPLTHDLFSNIFEATGVRLERVLVDALIDGTYYGALELRTGDSDKPIYVDARPSDSLALAVREGAAIFVAPKVIEAARGLAFEPLPDEEIVTALGITVVSLTDQLREAMSLGDRTGVLVSRAVGAAAKAGIAAGALILSVNGETPQSPMGFLDLVRRTPSNEKTRIIYWTDGEKYEVELSTDAPDIHRIRDAASRLRV